MQKTTKISLVLFLALAAVQLPGLAQSAKPLAGGLRYDSDHAETRIRRNAGATQTTVQTPVSAPLQAQTAIMDSLDAQVFSVGAHNTQLKSGTQATSFLPPVQIPIPQFQPIPQAQPKPTGAPYVWVQSAMGGYYDSSRTTPDVVRADRLHQYGGKFEDGTPVPREPIKDFNAAGHAYRAQKLDTSHFWNH